MRLLALHCRPQFPSHVHPALPPVHFCNTLSMYIAAEIIELSGNCAQARGSETIHTFDIDVIPRGVD